MYERELSLNDYLKTTNNNYRKHQKVNKKIKLIIIIIIIINEMQLYLNDQIYIYIFKTASTHWIRLNFSRVEKNQRFKICI